MDMIALAMDKISDKESSPNTAAESDSQIIQNFSDTDLPDEIWDEIMMCLDISDLTNLRRVSKRWLKMADRVIKRESKWYEKCLEDIPKKYWTSILEHQTNPKLSCNAFYKSKIHSRTWMSMHKSWLGWKNLIDKATSQKTIDISQVEYAASIGGLSMSGNIIAVGIEHDGTCNSHIDVYDISKLNERPIITEDRVDGDNYSSFVSIHVCQKDNDVMVVSLDRGRDTVRYWKVAPMLDIKPTVIKDTAPNKHSEFYVSSSLGYCYTLRRFYTYSDDPESYPDTTVITMSIERLPKTSDSRIITFTLPEPDPISYHFGIVADGDKVILLSAHKGGTILKMRELSAHSGELIKLSTINSRPYNGNDFEICNPQVVAFLNGSEIGFSVAGRRFNVYNIVQDLNLTSKVTSYLYHIGLLILGFETGEICIINVKDVDGLEDLNLETMRCRFIKLDTSDIPAKREVYFLAVTEHNTVQYIVAATDYKIHLVEFH